MKIPLKYKVQLQGEYNVGISYCPNSECDFEINYNNMDWFLGFTDDYIVCECPKCFTKWHFHHRGKERIESIIIFLEDNN